MARSEAGAVRTHARRYAVRRHLGTGIVGAGAPDFPGRVSLSLVPAMSERVTAAPRTVHCGHASSGGAEQPDKALDGVGEDPRPFGDAVGEHAEVLLQRDHVRGVLGDIGGRDAHIGRVQGERVADPVTEEGDPPPLRRRARTIRALCAGLTRMW